MGQAKIRKDEINILKSTTESMKIIAVKHMQDKSSVVLTLNIIKSDYYNSKDHLLKKICLSSWTENLPLDEINQYVLMTEGYKIAKLFNSYAIAIHFYESDRDRPSSYSCRDIISIRNKEKFMSLIDEYVSISNCLIDSANLFE